MRFVVIVFLILLSILSCSKKNSYKVDISSIDVHLLIKRYEVDFYNASKEKLQVVKNKYPFLFPKSFTDSIAISKINNNDEQELFIESQKIYKNISFLETQLFSVFKHIKYYNAKFKTPKVVTILSNIDYENRIIYADSLLFISLDSYLGKEHKYYSDYPKYIKENNTQENIIVDVANSIIEKQIKPVSNRRFIDKIIHEGKKMFLLDLYLPEISDKLKIGYTQEKLQWAIENQEDIWKYFIERKLLFSTETKLNKRFIDNAPFSKFYLENDRQSPGKIGVWLGWQIVRSFMQNNDVSLQELITIDTEELFKKSKYKPKK
ncbi:MAG: gliding motility lipoprotein GldB [Polaribacter sp.]|uniref:gliding motility lipoprotein GldB n=1 Tax=Polaribacter sp. TaxID=1920175 RepID=UPI0032650444